MRNLYKNYLKLTFVFLFVFSYTNFLKAQERIKEDRLGRIEHEYKMLINPASRKIPENITEKELLYVFSTDAQLQPSFKEGYSSRNTDRWFSRGPRNLGGRTRALAIDINDENIILAGGVSGGMWRSSNGGTNWRRTTATTQLPNVSCVAQDTRSGNTSTWYYGTGELTGNSASGGSAPYRGDGIFKSTDNGVTWAQLEATADASAESFTSKFQYVWNILVNPSNGDVYAATYGAIYRSTDGGTSWTEVLNGGDASYTDIGVTSTGVLYATISSTNALQRGVFRSTNGTTWTDITPAALPSTYNRMNIAIAPSNESVVYIFAATPASGVGETNNEHSFFKYTYLSGNGSGSGGTWVNRTSNLPSFGGVVGDLNQANYNQFVKVKPDDENVVFIGSTNLYRSTDAFTTSSNTAWVGGYSPRNNVSRYKNQHPDQHSLVFLPSDPKTMIVGHDGGLSKTTDNLATNAGGTDGTATLPIEWTDLNNGYYTTQAYAVAIDPNTIEDNRILAGFQDNGKWSINSDIATADWSEEIGGGDGSFVAIVAGKDVRYISTQNGSVARVEGADIENPDNWDHVHPAAATGQLFINPFILDKNDQKIMYYPAGSYIWRNNDVEAIETGWDFDGTNASSWTRLSNTFISSGTMSALDVSKSSPANVLYYGTSNGQVYKLSNAQATNPTATNITGISFPTGAYVSCITVDNTEADEVFVVFSNYGVISIWYSQNGGSSWTNVSGNLEQNSDGTGNGPSVRWLAISNPPNGTKTYYAGTSTGLYSTTSLNGTSTSWTQESANEIGNVVVTMVVARDTDGLVVAATHANGIYSKGGVKITSIEEEIDNSTLEVVAYPNPTQNILNIKLENTTLQNAKVELYDLEGSLITEKLMFPYNTNDLEAKLSLGEFSSGVYILRVITGTSIKELKIVIE